MTNARIFRSLHERDGAFVFPNPWDIGSACILERMGFEALATTSAGMAFSMGAVEGAISLPDVLTHCRSLIAATGLPVAADLENGYGDSPEDVTATIKAAIDAGLAGGSIEDHTGNRDNPIYDETLAVERIRAACEARDAVAPDFVLTARCESLSWGGTSLDDVIRRLQAFEEAGADVLYAPGLHDLSSIRAVCEAVTKPVNVVMGMPGATFNIDDLAGAGVKRISVGSAFMRVAYGAFIDSAREIIGSRSFTKTQNGIGFAELEAFFMTEEPAQ